MIYIKTKKTHKMNVATRARNIVGKYVEVGVMSALNTHTHT